MLDQKSKKEALRWGYFVGLLTNLMLLYWIGWATLAGAISAILVLPAYVALFAFLHVFSLQKWGEKSILLAPVWWTSIEWIKSLGQIGFPWFTLGYSQSRYLSLIQFAEYVSVIGISFWVLLINVQLYTFLQSIRHKQTVYKPIIILGLLFLLPFLHGKMVIPEKITLPDADKIRIGLVQGNIDPFQKWKPQFKDSSFTTYTRLTEQVARFKPDLIIWPETATPCWLRYEYKYLSQIKHQLDTLNIPLLTGTPDYQFVSETEYRTYNAAILIQPHSAEIQTYYKLRLVPFGERIPYEDSFPFTLIKGLLNKLEMGQGNFSPGDRPVVFSFPRTVTKDASHTKPPAYSSLKSKSNLTTSTNDSIRFGVAICYESVFPKIVNKFIKLGAQFQVIITNDAWFGKTAMPFQHLYYAVFRAIENRVSIARGTNTGISAFIDPYGHITSTTPLYQEAILVDEIPLLNQKSFYVKYGNIFSNGILIFSAFLLVVLIFYPRKKSRL